MWHYLHDATTGRLLSETSRAEDVLSLPVGVLVLTRSGRAADSEMWDPTTRAFVTRPAKVLVDRLQELQDDPELSAVWARLTAAQRTVLRDRLLRLLGRFRWRNPANPVDLA